MLIIICILAPSSFLCNLYVIIFLISKNAIKSISSKCILYLHFTQILQTISLLPIIYSDNTTVCQLMGFLNYYSSFANVCVSAAINIVIYQLLFLSNNRKQSIWVEVFIFALPLITLLPFLDDQYGKVNNSDLSYCSLKYNEEGNTWSYAVLYGWVWAILLFSAIIFMTIIYKVHKANFSPLFSTLMTTVGVYPLVTAIFWVPRTLHRVQGDGINVNIPDLNNIPVFACGIVYTVVFLLQKKRLERNAGESSEEFIDNTDFGTSLLLPHEGSSKRSSMVNTSTDFDRILSNSSEFVY